MAHINDPAWRKSISFDNLMTTIETLDHFSPNEIITLVCDMMPISTANAFEDANTVKKDIINELFQTRSLMGVAFIKSNGKTATFSTDTFKDRPENIVAFKARCTIVPELIDNRIEQEAFSITYCLPLPQYTWTGQSDDDPELIHSTIQDDISTILSTSHGSDIGEANEADAANTTIISHNSNATSTSTLSSKMIAIFAPTQGSACKKSYYGPLTFLDDQSTFHCTFGMKPVLIPDETRTHSQREIGGDPSSVQLNLRAFAEQCKLDVFLHSCRRDYVGDIASTTATMQSVQEICTELSHMKQTTTVKGKKEHLSPDELYQKFLHITPNLPRDVTIWSIQLCSAFYSALDTELKERMTEDNFIMPNLMKLTTKAKQLEAMRFIRECAIKSYKGIEREELRLQKLIAAKFGTRQDPKRAVNFYLDDQQQSPTLQHPPQQMPAPIWYHQPNSSQAETTMNRYKGNSSPPPNPHNLPTRIHPTTGLPHPYNPNSPDYLSRYPLGFMGCFNCGELDHRSSRECKKRVPKEERDLFWKDLWIHKPSTRKSPSNKPNPAPVNVATGANSVPIQHNAYAPRVQPTTNHRQIDNRPAWMSKDNEKTSHQQWQQQLELEELEDDSIFSKRNRVMAYSATVLVTNHNANPMPIDIDNRLPGISLRLGTSNANEISILCHVDTCAAMCTGNLKVHKWIMTAFPETVMDYVEFDDTEPFNPVQLSCAIEQGNIAPDSGKLTAVVRYWTRYKTDKDEKAVVSFALGKDVNVNSILGLPLLQGWKSDILLSSNQMAAWAIKSKFQLIFESSDPGIPEHTKFDPDQDFVRPAKRHTLTAATNVIDFRISEKTQAAAFTDGCQQVDRHDLPRTSVVTTVKHGKTFTQTVQIDKT